MGSIPVWGTMIPPASENKMGVYFKRKEIYIWSSTCSWHVRGCSVTQSCPTLCDPMDWSLPDSSVHGIFQAGILEWIAISFSRESSWPRNRNCVSCTAGRFISTEPKTNIFPKSTSLLKRCVSEVKFLYFHFYDNRDNCILDNFPCLLISFWSLFHFYVSLIAHSVSSEEKKIIISFSYSFLLWYCHEE